MKKAQSIQTAIGLVASMLCCVLCGWVMSFNVISVDLKTNYNLTQTQVELMVSINSAVSIAFVISALVIGLLGFKICYVMSIVLVTSSSLLLSWSVSSAEFVKDWTLLFGFLLLFINSGYILAIQCCVGVGVLKISKRHSGKLICFYTAATSLGRSYYAFIREVLYSPGDLYDFFRTMSIPFWIVTVLCVFFHQEPVSEESDSKQEKETLLKDDPHDYRCDQKKPSEMSRKDLLSSGILQLAVFSTGITLSVIYTFMNNVTIIAHAVGFEHHEFLIYTYSICGFVSRIIFGFLVDFVGTIRGAAILLYLSYSMCCVAMFLGFMWLNGVGIFIITVIVSMFSSSCLPISKVMLNMIFGSKNYVFISGYSSFIGSVSFALVQVLVGILYDTAQNRLAVTEIFCAPCFHWVFLLLFSLSILAIFQHFINVIVLLKSDKLKVSERQE